MPDTPDYTLSDEQRKHVPHLLWAALLSAMDFIADRLEDSSQESYELIGFDDSVSTLLDYFGYKVVVDPQTMEADLLNHDGKLIRHSPSRKHAWLVAMQQIAHEEGGIL